MDSLSNVHYYRWYVLPYKAGADGLRPSYAGEDQAKAVASFKRLRQNPKTVSLYVFNYGKKVIAWERAKAQADPSYTGEIIKREA